MKKIIVVTVALLLCAVCLAGCAVFLPNEPTADGNFAFGYQIDKTTAEQGERIAITVTVTNISGKDYTYTGSYSDYRADARLHSFDSDGEIDKVINHEPSASTTDIGKRVVKDGESLSATYYFNIPENADCTYYTIYISCFGYGREIKDVIRVVEKQGETTTTVPESNSGMFSEGRLYFPDTRPLRREALLVDSKGSLTWIYSPDESFFEGFDSGDYVKIEHGFVMESYPAQTYASDIELIEDGDIYSFTDEEWERLSWPFTDPPER